MINKRHVFDPIWDQLFLKQYTENKEEPGCDIDGRSLFYQLSQTQLKQHNIYSAYRFLNQCLEKVDVLNNSVDILKSSSLEKIEPFPEELAIENNLKSCLDQTAAIQLTQPCWLENVAQAAFCQSKLSVDMMLLYSQLRKIEEGEGLVESYQALIISSGFKLPVLHSHDFSQRKDICSEIYDLAAAQLALSQFPRVLLAENLGFTLACIQLPTLFEICFPNHCLETRFFKQRQHCVEQQVLSLKSIINNYLKLFPDQKNQLTSRIQQGFYLYQLLIKKARDQIFKQFSKKLSPDSAMIALIQKKAIAAIGHHQKIQLEGVSLDQWFNGLPENSQAFIQALKSSNYVDQKNPAASRIIKLFEFDGPMYGVLDTVERDTLLSWLKQEATDTAIVKPELFSLKNNSIPLSNKKLLKPYVKLKNRQLYYYLINRDLFPDVLPRAHWKVRTTLRLCSMFNKLPFKQYSHPKFEHYIETIYQQEIAAYQPLKGKPKISREAYIWGIEQIAPMILIDGCWLQNSLSIRNTQPEISDILFRIYEDEIGQGVLQQNHPYIFQNLLDSLMINVPDVYSQTFVEHKRFINSAFDLPVFMLSLSYFTTEFLPELLGLNMAIELSGLGNNYLKLVDEWNYWEIDPTIANIHISIDNYQSGHTFMAKKAIQLYMDDILKRTGDEAEVNKHWRRIHNGYATLRFVGKRFKLALPIRYLNYKVMLKK